MIEIERPHRMLWSYHYAKRSDLADVLRQMAHKPVVFADSGAFSALTQGAVIELDAYAAWLEEHHSRFEVYANLDVIGDPKATAKNQDKLEAKGLRPLPVFHGGAPMKWLDHYADAGHTYIALGGTVGISQADRMRWFVQAFMWAQKRVKAGKSKVVFHGFGVTTPSLMAALPWYSVDSTSWNAGARYGELSVFDPLRGGEGLTLVHLFDPKSVFEHQRLLALYGARPEAFLDRENYHFSEACTVAARSWRAFEDECRRRHGLIEHPPMDNGLHLYMAATSRSDLTFANRALTPGLHLYLADGSQQNHLVANQALTPPQEPAP